MSADTNTPPVKMTVHAELGGWPVDLHFDMPPATLGKAIDRLASLGYTPRRPIGQPAAAAPKPARPRATRYDADGTPLCPTHGTPMREGQHGWYCPKKATEGQPANQKGYCSAVADD